MKIPATTVRHNVGTCPACHGYLWADVDIEVNVSAPEMTREGRATAYVNPAIVGMAVAHSCWRDDDGEVHTRDTAELGDLGDMAQAWDDGHRDVCNDCCCPPERNPYRAKHAEEEA